MTHTMFNTLSIYKNRKTVKISDFEATSDLTMQQLRSTF